MHTRLIALLGIFGLSLGLSWYVVAQNTAQQPRFESGQVLTAADLNTMAAGIETNAAEIAANAAVLQRIVDMGTQVDAPTQLVTGLQGAAGSTLSPDGALYVTEGAIGRISRVDLQTGEVTTFAEGLPPSIIGIGGVIDVAFISQTAYALVTLVGPDVGGSDIDGIYRVDGPDSFTVIADLGEFSANNPPATQFDLPNGVQYALQTYQGGFLVTDGHHNRVLRVSLDGAVSEFIAFDNIVPTGLDVSGDTVYMAEAGPVPHLPEDGKVVAFGPESLTVTEIASGAPLLVDVEFGSGRRLYALSQGEGMEDAPPGSPALPNTGSLVEVNADGTFTVLTDGLNQPTSLEVIENTLYVITLTGEIWKFDDISGLPFGVSP